MRENEKGDSMSRGLKIYMWIAGVTSLFLIICQIVNKNPENTGLFIQVLVVKGFIDIFFIAVWHD